MLKDILNEEDQEVVVWIPESNTSKIQKNLNITRSKNQWGIKKFENWLLKKDDNIIIEELEAEKFNEILIEFFSNPTIRKLRESSYKQILINLNERYPKFDVLNNERFRNTIEIISKKTNDIPTKKESSKKREAYIKKIEEAQNKDNVLSLTLILQGKKRAKIENTNIQANIFHNCTFITNNK